MAAPHVVRIGAPGHGLLEFVSRVAVRNLNAKVRFELPGEVVRFGRSDLLSIIPTAAIARGDQRVLVSVAERSRPETDEALGEVRLGRSRAIAFSIRVEAPGVTFGELLADAAEPKSRPSTHDALLRVLVRASGRERSVVSPPFPGVLAGSDDHGPGGEDSEGYHLFPCHSHWHAVLPFPPLYRYTYCHGSCKGGLVCSCNKGKSICEGWCTCTCK